ncbi:MAG: uroporphyrinogen-III synthase [Pseudonocardiales bacterium]|nr:uroporphyrinogen-III synthase [Pseudonocardiales bacterium]
MTGVPDLAGYTVGITAARRREEFGSALERRGAKVMYGPAIRIIPLADDTELLEATKRCLAAPLDLLVATTGIGFRGWMDAAATWGLNQPLTAALSAATILARGPKVRGAVRAADLREAWSPESESSSEVLEHLVGNYALDGLRVAVQLHGEPLPDLVETLRASGADVIEVPVYRWVSPEDGQPLRRLIEATAAASIDAVTFTSAPAAVNFLRTADDLGFGAEVRGAMKGPVLCAAVGSVTAAPLLRNDIPVVQPQRFRLGALVREVVERLPARAQVLAPAGHRLEIRGHAVLLDGTLLPLPGAGMNLLRELAGRPGQVFSRDALGRLLPGESRDGHAVEVAIARLRTALGDPAIIQTVVKRGYRLNVEH